MLEACLFIVLLSALILAIVFLYFFVKEVFQIFFGYGVPFVPSSDIKIAAFLDELQLKKGDTFLDLGSGDGKVLEAVEQKFPKVELVGIENSYFPHRLSLRRKERNA